MSLLNSEFVCSHTSAKDIHILAFDELDSTNSYAKLLAQSGAPEGTLVVASHQTTGRGRIGRSFYSPDDSGLYMSLVLRPQLSADKCLYITTLAAVSMCRAIISVYGLSPTIKWVNDILVQDRKVCGILTEGSFSQNKLDFVILGIGVNISPPSGGFPDELSSVAGFLSDEPTEYQRETLCASFLDFFFSDYPFIAAKPHLDAYRNLSCLVGQDVIAYRSDGSSFCCRVDGVDDEFGLRVLLPDDTTSSLFSGEVSVRCDHSSPPLFPSQ